ncbi:MAG: right-handed parallel beta-helix repeat-containing protein [Verrucomicrobia bacterium]|jgi:hypothetical protein|nr:right-handed parallel beta-helix repeat-containing protein [Verrucomicrobiota bacterium]MBT7701496.1 right-handed parallel beta-helix repeat-containing protein [Verrucomicrobiota bacterium]
MHAQWGSLFRIGISCLAAAVMSDVASAQTHSELWGRHGEKWSPQSRLPDFSFAGYHFGEDPLPQVKVVADVTRFGAKGDGKTDDTAAFKRAIAETEQGAILVPAGHYLLSDILWIEKSGIVLRGEGTDKTVLHFTSELEDVRPNMGATTSGKKTSNYSWSGGFLWVKGGTKSALISPIASECTRGDKTLLLEKAGGIKVGQRVQVALTDDAQKTLLVHLYSGDSGPTTKFTKAVKVSMVSRVAAVSGKQVTLERPLRWDIRKGWKPTLKTFEPRVSEVGIEELAISFPLKPYQGHFSERGMNGIAMNGVSDCWVRNVKISNCDSGIFVGGSFCTVDGLVVDGSRTATRGDTGHHGVTMGRDCVLQNFDFQTKFIHDITMSNLQVGNVVKNGKGINLSFDHHKRCPYENLFCNIDVGDGGQVWRCGGGRDLGKNCGARGTFWGIKAKQDIKWPRKGFGPDSMNIVGVKTQAESMKDPNGKWFEAMAPESLLPADLHAAQLAARLMKKP